jgi:formamidopyrimidine-DNA glycosylase
MPELAEVEYYRKQWSSAVGDPVRRVSVNSRSRVFEGTDTRALAEGLVGQALAQCLRHGKQMCFVFGEVHWLGVHLGMTGKIGITATDAPRLKHDHLVVSLESGRSLVFSDPRTFGRIRYECERESPFWWVDLPPEPLNEAFTQERLESYLRRHASVPIKAFLLQQAYFPGIGNWMADEILWRSRIQPWVLNGDIGPMKRAVLLRITKEVCRDALEVIGTDWGTPPDSWLFNHRWKDGGICPRTGGPLKRITIAGRTTCWSPLWQIYRGKRLL